MSQRLGLWDIHTIASDKGNTSWFTQMYWDGAISVIQEYSWWSTANIRGLFTNSPLCRFSSLSGRCHTALHPPHRFSGAALCRDSVGENCLCWMIWGKLSADLRLHAALMEETWKSVAREPSKKLHLSLSCHWEVCRVYLRSFFFSPDQLTVTCSSCSDMPDICNCGTLSARVLSRSSFLICLSASHILMAFFSSLV